jgi:signal transduction histidine kinase
MTISILYIEDDPASRSLVERALRFGGYKVLVAACGLEGIDLARREAPDLILTDINLPDMSGREITTTLRGDPRFKATPIVALTAQTLKDQRELTFAAGITGYITKPLDVDRLLDQVKFYLGGGQDQIDQGALTAAQSRYTQELVSRLETRVRDLEAINQSLRRLDKMKDTFIQLTAHELRTPLTLVYGYSRLLEDNPDVKAITAYDHNLQMLLDGLTGSIGRMQGIINEILTISRIMTNNIDLSVGPTDLGNIIQRVIRTYAQPIEERRMNVQFNKADFPERLSADWELLELAVRNLISNAIKYTPDGGTITISGRTEGETVRVSIRDTGIGIAPGEQQTIFERFHTTNDVALHSTSKTAFRGGGIGLGLAICKGIVEAHGGRIWVESPGHDPAKLPGSEFIVVLPLIARFNRKSKAT